MTLFNALDLQISRLSSGGNVHLTVDGTLDITGSLNTYGTLSITVTGSINAGSNAVLSIGASPLAVSNPHV